MSTNITRGWLARLCSLITGRGNPAAKVAPPNPGFDREKARRAAERIIANSKRVTLGGLKIKDLINEGRR